MTDATWAVVIVNVIGFLTVIINNLSTARKAADERRAVAMLAEQKAKEIAAQLDRKEKAEIEAEERRRRYAREDREEAIKHREKVLMTLTDVGLKADLAYKEANAVNLKIADIGLKVADGSKLEPHKPGGEVMKE